MHLSPSGDPFSFFTIKIKIAFAPFIEFPILSPTDLQSQLGHLPAFHVCVDPVLDSPFVPLTCLTIPMSTSQYLNYYRFIARSPYPQGQVPTQRTPLHQECLHWLWHFALRASHEGTHTTSVSGITCQGKGSQPPPSSGRCLQRRHHLQAWGHSLQRRAQRMTECRGGWASSHWAHPARVGLLYGQSFTPAALWTSGDVSRWTQ